MILSGGFFDISEKFDNFANFNVNEPTHEPCQRLFYPGRFS